MPSFRIAIACLIFVLSVGKVSANEQQCFVEEYWVSIERKIDENCVTDFLRQFIVWTNDLAERGSTYFMFFEIGHLKNEATLQGYYNYTDEIIFMHISDQREYSQDILLENGWMKPADADLAECLEPLLCRVAPSKSVFNGELAQIIMQWFYATTQNPNTDKILLTFG